jgi:hypothetical protein
MANASLRLTLMGLASWATLSRPFGTQFVNRVLTQAPKAHDSSVENISKEEHPHRDLSTTLRFGRDDKGESRYGPEQRSRD